MRNTNSVRAVVNGDEKFHVKACRAEALLDELRDGCVSLIVTDPPYFKVKDEEWDRAWKNPREFLAWLGGIFDRFRRVLAPNGSLYVFASPQMEWSVEGEVRKRFEVLSTPVWAKPIDGYEAGDSVQSARRRGVAHVFRVLGAGGLCGTSRRRKRWPKRRWRRLRTR
jgi:DNA modification methylase